MSRSDIILGEGPYLCIAARPARGLAFESVISLDHEAADLYRIRHPNRSRSLEVFNYYT